MSIKQMAQVWDLDLDHAQRLVLLALADHAHDDGHGARPAVRLVAWKTGYTDRSVKRILHELREAGLIEVALQGGGRLATVYTLCLDRGKLKPPYKKLGLQDEGGHFDTRDTQDTSGVSPRTPQPSVEPSLSLKPLVLAVRSTKVSVNGKGTEVGAIVDLYRSIAGVQPSKKDGGVIAGLVGKYGAEAVKRTLDAEGPSIAAADSPLLWLASRFRRSRGQGPAGETVAERTRRYAESLKRAWPPGKASE